MKKHGNKILFAVFLVVLSFVCLIVGIAIGTDSESAPQQVSATTVAPTPLVEVAIPTIIPTIISTEKPTVIPTEVILTRTPYPTRTPKPTKEPTTSFYDETCKTLDLYEMVLTAMFGRVPNFQPTNVGVWDLAWIIEEPTGSYGIFVTEKNGCLIQGAAISVLDIDGGDAESAGEMMGAVTGFFSTAENGWDWLGDKLNNECPLAFENYTDHKLMDDGTTWEISCQSDLIKNQFSVGISIYPPGW